MTIEILRKNCFIIRLSDLLVYIQIVHVNCLLERLRFDSNPMIQLCLFVLCFYIIYSRMNAFCEICEKSVENSDRNLVVNLFLPFCLTENQTKTLSLKKSSRKLTILVFFVWYVIKSCESTSWENFQTFCQIVIPHTIKNNQGP
jgi:hypothetical protein